LQIYTGWPLTKSVLCEREQQHTINNVVDMCSLTKVEGILQSVQEVDHDALTCLETTVTTAL